MTQTYFSKFPIINYNGQQAVNISERVSFLNTVAKDPYLYYSYDISNDIRSDQVAEAYYSDPYMNWLVFMSNQVVDPYYDWYLPYDDFTTYIISQYGSVQQAQETVIYYRNNWYDNPNPIDPSVYAAYPPNIQKYYAPVLGYNNVISAYTRIQEDWIINTNMMVNISPIDNVIFTKGEIVDVYLEDVTNGYGTVIASGTNSLSIQHINGTVVPTSDCKVRLVGRTSGATFTYLSSQNLTFTVYSNVPNDELVYYSPVTYYDYEDEKNNNNKSIRLLNNSYATQVSIELTRLLK